MNRTENRESGWTGGQRKRIDGPRILREKTTVQHMILLYCKLNHQQETKESGLCPDCRKLNKYALNRLTYCRFGEDKTSCQYCEIHCYAPEYQEQIRKVMRFAGPRMFLRHPILTLRHLLDDYRSKR